jgi:hypothetical protein
MTLSGIEHARKLCVHVIFSCHVKSCVPVLTVQDNRIVLPGVFVMHSKRALTGQRDCRRTADRTLGRAGGVLCEGQIQVGFP